MARIFFSKTSIANMLSVYKCLDAVGIVKEAITQDAHRDLYWCIHFVGDWEVDSNEEQEYVFLYDTKVVVDDTTASHQFKFAIVEDGFNS